MATVRRGDTVRVCYTISLTGGRVCDTTHKHNPCQFTVGAGDVIRGLEEAVIGLVPGDTKTVSVGAADAYGPRTRNRVATVPRHHITDGVRLEEGAQLEAQRTDGGTAIVRVVGLSDHEVTLDANHPLAGKDLRLRIRLVDIVQGGTSTW